MSTQLQQLNQSLVKQKSPPRPSGAKGSSKRAISASQSTNISDNSSDGDGEYTVPLDTDTVASDEVSSTQIDVPDLVEAIKLILQIDYDFEPTTATKKPDKFKYISIWLNQAVKGARDRHGNAIQNAHLLTLFHRLCKLLFFKIRPIFVFDGEAPQLKKQTLAKRRRRKDVAAIEAKKTNEKLLRTFLKRQAIKAALSGKKQSNEEFPSISYTKRKEEEDIYALPPLEDKGKNSSEEEEDREWEERINEKRILQEEFFADPHAVDIDSEDFISLPPEMKHEILTDMKEFTKRRRTLFETMPEDSNDFSQYQLKGLLKKNNLNRCLNNVRKEMTQQYTGEVTAQFETEGGFMKDVESRRLVSEDTSHYILIKGIQSKTEDKKEEISEQDMPSSSSAVMPKTYLDLKLASAHKSKKVKDRVPDAAPPSPRTLFAIQEAMEQNSSDEENRNKVTHSSLLPSESLCAVDGNVSPRTLHAIQQALAEDEVGVSKKRSVDLSDKNDKFQKELPKAKVLIISNSDEEDQVLASETGASIGPIVSLTSIEISPSPTHIQTIVQNDKSISRSSVPVTQSEPLHKSNTSKVGGEDLNVVKRNLFHSQDISVKSSLQSISSCGAAASPLMLRPVLESNKSHVSTNIDMTILNSAETENSGLESCKNPHAELAPCKTETILQPSTSVGIQSDTPSEASEPASPFLSNMSVVQAGSSSAALLLQEQEVIYPKEENSTSQQPSSSNVPKITYVPMTPESISVTEAESDRDKEMDSDSDGSFIEVESDLDNSNLQEVNVMGSPKDSELRPGRVDSAHAVTMFSSNPPLQNTIQEDDRADAQDAVLQQGEESEKEETAASEWQDISVEELESLENNLFVQQTSLQAQKQQQERIAATVTGQMCLESQELLRLFGIPFIVAPMEAEAQCAVLDLTDQTSGTITDDSDIWLFGARHVYKNFFSQNKYVEYYQFSDIQNQLGLDRTRLINLAYLMGSDYTDGIPSVGYVSAMEILNEFPGHGLEPLLKFKEWWVEAQKNKKMRPNPHDTKVKKKLRDLELHPGFPNQAVADAYLKPVADESKGAFAWGRPDLEQIREFCETRFGWFRSKTDEVILPVLKQLNTQQTQLRIDSFFRVEQHEAHALKSQRLRRAVTCMKRKERDNETMEIEEASALMEKEYAHGDQKGAKSNRKSQKGRKKNGSKLDSDNSVGVEGGFLGAEVKALSPAKNEGFLTDSDTGAEDAHTCTNISKARNVTKPVKTDKMQTSSSSDDEEKVLVSAKPVFQGNKKKPRTQRGRKK
ncbi:DNA excision repair protein ERCC-5 [Pseudophryne corroboree]|uniref:DNA excision repair protein ERCC-5 n=1 Tax=Pseudophryne corroboree TaxID=495146 RepID=UPI00308189DE